MEFLIVIGVIIFTFFLLARLFKGSSKSNNTVIEIKPNENAKPYCVIFDVETTGLPPRGLKLTKATVEQFPRIVQLSFGVYSRKGEIIGAWESFVKQEKPIPKRATEIHGITTEKANQEGEKLEDVLNEFIEAIKDTEAIVAHNLEFDKAIVEAEFLRTGIGKPFVNKRRYCTMKGWTRRMGGKYPKLEEWWEFITKDPLPDGGHLHDATYDLKLTSALFFMMKEAGFWNYN